tara:strand:+ start:247 stop:507 length:261 start_codon:yes stop_codon:yes gene_type:complete
MDNFIIQNRDALIQIYIKERLAKGEGVLMIVKADQKANVMYSRLTDLDKPLRDNIIKLKEENPQENKIYFYLCKDDKSAELIQIDL